MKKLLAVFLTICMLFVLAACSDTPDRGQTGDPSTEQTSKPTTSENHGNVGGDNKIEFTQSEKILSHTIYCPKECSVRNSDYGKAFSYKTDFSVILEAPASVGSMYSVNGFDDVVEKSEEYICKSLESRNSDLFHPGATEQEVSASKEVTVNGIKMLRVEGQFKNTQAGTAVEYVAYYLLASANDGNNYPIYVVGVPLAGSTADVGEFIDLMMSKVEKK